MTAPRTTERPHGRAKYVVEKCRCEECRKAAREYGRNRVRQRAYGRAAYVDAEPVRAHMHLLQETGIGWKRVATIAGIEKSVVCKLLYGARTRGMGPSKRVRPATAEKILAVKPSLDLVADNVAVDATGTRRRLQALVALGWSQSQIARRLGMLPTNFTRVMTAPTVGAGTVRAVRVLYDELWDQAPKEDDHRSRISVSRARNHARKNGWLPPMAWDDDIDNPDAKPVNVGADGEDVDEVAVARVLRGAPADKLNSAERAEVVRRMTEAGSTPNAIALRLRTSIRKVRNLLAEAAS